MKYTLRAHRLNMLTHHLSDILSSVLLELGFDQKQLEKAVLIERPTDPSHGHFATAVALKLFGMAQKDDATKTPFPFSNPRDLAGQIAEKLLEAHPSFFQEVSVAGPGFVNMTLSDSFFLQQLSEVVSQETILVPQVLKGRKIMVEFTDPNPFKELHIGHLYSNTIGEAISRLLEAQGAEVQRACYQGDVGMHVAKSVWGMRLLLQEQFPDLSTTEAIKTMESQPLSKKVQFLGKAYAKGASAYKDDTTAAEEIKDINYLTFLSGQENLVEKTGWKPQVDYKQYVAKSTQNYAEIKELYFHGRAWSLAYFDSMYQRIVMQFDEFFFESSVGEYGAQIVQDFLEKGIFEESQGAVIFPGEKYGLHNRVFINSLGLPTYEAKELGLAPEKYRRFPYDTSLIITGNEIDEYFKVLLKALALVHPELRKKTVHMSHGMVRLPEGKMSSRTGKILTAEWLMNEAHARIESVLAETRTELLEEEKTTISEVVGLSAIKFAFLKQSIGKDIAFDFNESLSFTGNSGPYLLYTLVRTKSVLHKAEKELGKMKIRSIAKQYDTVLNRLIEKKYTLTEIEKDLLLNILIYSDAVERSASEYAPHHVAQYLFELAQSFNAFYGSETIVDAKSPVKTQLRIVLTLTVGRVVQHGLEILGIKTVEKM